MSLCLILFTSQILYASPFSAQQKDKEKMLKDMMQKSDDVPPLVSIADELTMMWIEPMNQLPALYEKIEWGIQLPASVNKAIENWISNDLKQTNLRPAINPFDPEQIDLSATIQYSKDGKMISQPVNGFFYEEFDRITHVSNATSIPTLSDPNFWHWQSIPTPYTFRIRWSADALAEHQVKILLSVPSLGKWELPVFQFTSLGGSTKNSFISISSNKHYFKTDDDKLFFQLESILLRQVSVAIARRELIRKHHAINAMNGRMKILVAAWIGEKKRDKEFPECSLMNIHWRPRHT